jgi:hypothetical protein
MCGGLQFNGQLVKKKEEHSGRLDLDWSRNSGKNNTMARK